MVRIQLALNVSDLEAAIGFYSLLLQTEPCKRRPGYATFSIDNPPLKLALVEGEDGGSIHHLGLEVESSGEVSSAASRFDLLGLDTLVEEEVPCGYAIQDKVWVTDPDGAQWKVYAVLRDAVFGIGGAADEAEDIEAAPQRA